MVAFLLVSLFCVALVITFIGSYLPPRSHVRARRNIVYPPRPGRDPEQGERTRNTRRTSAEDQPYRQLRRPYAPESGYGEVEGGRGGKAVPIRSSDRKGLPPQYVDERGPASPGERSRRRDVNGAGQASPLEGEKSTRRYLNEPEEPPPFRDGRSTRRGVDEGLAPSRPLRSPVPEVSRAVRSPVPEVSRAVRSPVPNAPRAVRSPVPHKFKLTLLFGCIVGLFLFVFAQMAGFGSSPAMTILDNFAPQPTTVPRNTVIYGEDLGSANASKVVARVGQLDSNQYSSQNEYDQWANSACSAAAMTEIINAYGHNYRITDILKVEAGLHEITPELGLLEAKGIDRTMDRFGFKIVPLQHATLDDAIAVANQGHPVIVSFANSSYWSGGHILVLRGGDAQNVDLADSSRLDLTVVARDQFLQWWNGFTALAVPQ